ERYFIVKPVSGPPMGDTDETCPVYAQYYRCNNCAEHSNQSSKLSVVRDLRWRKLGRRDELRVHDISTMPGHGGWGSGFCQPNTQYVPPPGPHPYTRLRSYPY